MDEFTGELWRKQDRHPGDRHRLFAAVAGFVGNVPVLYPGSFVDIAASFVFDSVTYVDKDRRAARFFADAAGVDEHIGRHRQDPASWRFIAADYEIRLDVPDRSMGLLISLYAGFVSEHCTRYLAPGGWLLVNPSHGDAAMASIDSRYRLGAVVRSGSDGYSIGTEDLEAYLIPKRSIEITTELLHEIGRGIGYTRSPYAYLFQLEVI